MGAATVRRNNVSWMIGGPQGSGVDSSANVFARACAAGGLHVFGKREFYSNIMGEHSYFHLRAHTNLVRSHIDSVNVLATFEAETLFRHAREVTDDGADVFRNKAKLVSMNASGARKAYELAGSLAPDFGYRLERIARKEPRLFLTGSQATALGKLYGGMRFQTYYPITPASDESEFLEENEVLELNGHGLAPDAADATPSKATGASLTGARSATATSGPGFSLMMEGIGWASINEVPLVITLYQRAGPSTGMPTRHEQGDLRFALHAGHGEAPRILLASGDFEECIRDGFLAFNYAERYQMPVIHLVDKALANSYATVGVPDLSDLRVDRGATAPANDGYSKDNPYKRFDLGNGPVSPRAFLGQEGTIFWNTGDEHDEFGHITEDPVVRDAMMEKRFAKLDLAAREIPSEEKVKYFGPKGAPTVIVSWGSTKGALLDALDRLWAEGAKVGYLHVRLINPFPVDEVLAHLAKAKRRVGVEMNFGAQLAGIVRERTGIEMTHFIQKYNGRPMSNTELYDAVQAILRGKAEKRTVLTHGS